jgi:hypothetical protein
MTAIGNCLASEKMAPTQGLREERKVGACSLGASKGNQAPFVPTAGSLLAMILAPSRYWITSLG